MRLPRLAVPGLPQHIVIRGINGQTIFYSDHDYRTFLCYVDDARQKYQCELHAYVLMPNHIHMLITPSSSNGVAKFVQLIARQYVQYFNQHHNRTGTLWEGRYKSALVESDNFSINIYRYIEQNPVRNNLVKHPQDYPWSSYRHNAGIADNKLIAACDAYTALAQQLELRQQYYIKLAEQVVDAPTLTLIRQETNRSRVVGSEQFKKKIETRLGIDLGLKPRGGDRRSIAYLQSV